MQRSRRVEKEPEPGLAERLAHGHGKNRYGGNRHRDDARRGRCVPQLGRFLGAAALPGFMVWEAKERRYVLHFGPEVEIPHSDDVSADILEGTRRCTAAIES